MTALIAVLLIYGAIPHPNPGTYQIATEGETIIRMDTRTGAMERCSLVGNSLVCKQIVAQQ